MQIEKGSRYLHIKIKPAHLYVIIAQLIFFLILTVRTNLRFALFFIFAVFFNARLGLFQVNAYFPTRMELTTLASVVGSAVFGTGYGFLTGFFCMIAGDYAHKKIRREDLLKILLILISAVLASAFPQNIRVIGILLITVSELLMYFFRKYILSLSRTVLFSRTISNMIFNYIIFASGSATYLALFLSG